MRTNLVKLLAARGIVSATGSIRAGLRSAESAFYFSEAAHGTFRLRFGPRLTALEARTHGTPTGRCSGGHWVRLAAFETPTTARTMGRILDRCFAMLAETRCVPVSSFTSGIDYAPGDVNRCRSRANFDAPAPTAGSGSGGRGRVLRSNPSRLDGFGFAPASNKRLLQHVSRGGK
jgi:hypothetical protein